MWTKMCNAKDLAGIYCAIQKVWGAAKPKFESLQRWLEWYLEGAIVSFLERDHF